MGSPSPSTHRATAMMSMNTSLKTTQISSHTCLPFGASSSWVIMVARHLKSSTAHWFWSSRIQQLRIPVHVAFHGRLLPAVKFIHCPPRCFNCHHTGHFTRSCGARSSCGLCTGDHDTRKCRASQNDRPASLTPLKCAVDLTQHLIMDSQLARLPSTNIGLKSRMQAPTSRYSASVPSQAPSQGMALSDRPNLQLMQLLASDCFHMQIWYLDGPAPSVCYYIFSLSCPCSMGLQGFDFTCSPVHTSGRFLVHSLLSPLMPDCPSGWPGT